MNKNLVRDYLAITFSIMITFWGGCAIISQCFDLTVNHILLRIMHMIGGFSPTIASYLSLKKYKKVKTFREWFFKIFDVKHSAVVYGTVVLFVSIYYLLGCVLNGFEFGAPFFMIIILVPMMLVGGGNEEVGWRMILQPELEKKYGFHLSALFTGVIWWIWHFPIFFIKGTANADMNFILFGIMCLSLSYALAAIRRISNGVFPCILTHCLINGLSGIFLFSFGWISCLTTLIVMVAVSGIMCKFIPTAEG